MDSEAHLDLALVGAATPGHTTVVASMDTVNRTSSPHTTSTNRRLKRFTERVTKVRQPLLLELPGDDATHGGRAPSAPQEEQVDSGAEHVSYPGVQAR